jgi:hypothetical protein
VDAEKLMAGFSGLGTGTGIISEGGVRNQWSYQY